jgi:nucleoid-associated protein YgaU
LGDSTIGIKVADGSYYPVLEHGFTGTKKLTLTTAKKNQGKVQIDLYRGNGTTLSEAHYIGSLIIENIPPASQGEPEIELLLGIDDNGQLSARASDSRTGESQKFSTTITTLSAEDTYEEPEFEVEDTPAGRADFEEPPLTGESYPVTEEDRRRERVHAKGPNILLLVLFVIFGVLLVAAIAYFVYRSISGPHAPPLGTTGAATAPAAQAPSPQPEPVAQPAPAAQPAPVAPAPQAAAPAAPTPSKPAGGVTYRIKYGDTLWDISATYYRNPWLYPKLAKANSIKNPDLIFAGTRITIPEN